jgi:hypothetical protein
MAAKDVLAGQARGQGTKVAEYSEAGPFHCKDCTYLKTPGPDAAHGLCNQKVMLKDPQVKTDAKSKLKIVNIEHGCCRFVKVKNG